MYKVMRIILFIISVATTNCLLGQNALLEKKIQGHFFDIPVLQSLDSIIKFAKNNSRQFDLLINRDPLTAKIIYIDIDYWYYKKDTMYAYVYFRTGVLVNNQDSLGSTVIGINMPTKTLLNAKFQAKKLANEYSKFFSKMTRKRRKNPLMGGRWQTTSFYLNEKDKRPFMQISWSSKADMHGNGYSIEVALQQ